MHKLINIAVAVMTLVGCQTNSASLYGKKAITEPSKPTLTFKQKECIDLAEPSYSGNSNERTRKQSILKFFIHDCYTHLGPLGLKPEKYSFSSNYHTKGLPEPYQSRAVFKDLLSSGGDFPKNKELAEKVALALIGKGVPEAEIYIATKLLTTDASRAEDLFTSAAMQNHCVAQAHLAHTYFHGTFTKRNVAKSLFWSLQLQKRRAAGDDLDVWRPEGLSKVYKSRKEQRFTYSGYLANFLAGGRGSGLCSLAVYQHTFEKAFVDEYARQQVINLATFWETGSTLPRELDEIIFDEGQFKPLKQGASQSRLKASAGSQSTTQSLEKKSDIIAGLKAEGANATENDSRQPKIKITTIKTNDKKGTITGKIFDDVGLAEVLINGRQVQVNKDGGFNYETFIPPDGVEVSIEVTDVAGTTARAVVPIERESANPNSKLVFEALNPLSRKVIKNTEAIALIIGVKEYKNTPVDAAYADNDAIIFADFAEEKLGIPANRIKTLVNIDADEYSVLLAIQDWLTRLSKSGVSDIYIFFAGHGLASEDGENMYLLPYDGAPRLLSRTALLREELFSNIAAANPRSVTVFLDTCYSGTTRGTKTLIASRPIAIRAKEQRVPEGFTVMTAAAGDQTAKPLEEAKHGMFSYFLMKGMEGDADANRDSQITAGELHAYVQQNVIQQSSGSQTPELQGDANRVLVRFQ